MGNTHETHRIRGDNQLSRPFRAAQRDVAALGVSLGRLIAPVAALAGAGGFGALTFEAARAADQTAKLNQRLGISTELISDMRFATESVGVRFESFATVTQRLTRRVGEAAGGNKTYQKAIEDLGLSVDELMKLSQDERLLAFADALAEIEDPALRMARAFKIGDTEIGQLLPLLALGSEGIAEFRRQANLLGVTVDDSLAGIGEDVSQSITNLRFSMRGLGNELLRLFGEDLAGAINKLAIGIQVWAIDAQVGFKLASIAVLEFQQALNSLQLFATNVVSSNVPDALEFWLTLLNKITRIAPPGAFDAVSENLQRLLEGDGTRAGKLAEQTEQIQRWQATILASINTLQAKQTELHGTDLLGLPSVENLGPGGPGGGDGRDGRGPTQEELARRYGLASDEMFEEIKEKWAAQHQDLQDIELTSWAETEAELQESLDRDIRKRIEQEQKWATAKRRIDGQVRNSAMALFSTLGREHRSFAIAFVALEKAIAISNVITRYEQAIALAEATGRFGEVPRLRAAQVASVALIGAQGIAQIAQQSSGGAGGGSPGGEPIRTQASEGTSAGVGAPTQITVAIDDDALMSGAAVRALIERINNEIANGVVLSA